MKKQLFCTIFFVLLISVCFGQKPYKVVFYNLENFFDTINDPEVKDDEFTPEGPKKWNTAKYNKKLGNIERVLFGMAAIDKEYPIVIGVSEVENRNVLEDIVATSKLAPGNYRISHFDSPEARGVDVAFLYRPDVFKLEGQYPVQDRHSFIAGLQDSRYPDYVGNHRRRTVLLYGSSLALSPGRKRCFRVQTYCGRTPDAQHRRLCTAGQPGN